MSSERVGESIEVNIEKIVPKGLGLGFADGSTVFVALAAPGDRVRARITRIKGRTIFAEVEEVLSGGAERSVPPCPYFGACGGCDFQQLSYGGQLAAKVDILRDCLERIGKINYPNEIPIVGSPEPLNYRLRVQWHADTATRKIGYFRRESHTVIDVDHCPIASLPLNAALADLRENIEWETISDGRIEIEAANGSDGSLSWYSSELIEPTREIRFRAFEDEYRFSALTFFQGNQFQVENLIRLAVEGLQGRHAVDLFCGIGLFSLPLARRFQKVTGVESNRVAVEFARLNAESAGLSNIEFVTETVEDQVRSGRSDDVDLVVFDPPRCGTSKNTILQMLAFRPEVISYVSCEPSILARDLSWITERGYGIESIKALDLFPQTHHVETVVRLRKM